MPNFLQIPFRTARLLACASVFFSLALPFSLFSEEKPRIVSLNGTITEILFALGAGDRLVGVDTSSYYPKEAVSLPKIGYQRTLAAEGILSLKPNQIIGTNYAGPPATIEQLTTFKVPMLIVQETLTIEGVEAKIEQIAKFISKEKEGKALIQAYKKQVASLDGSKPKKPVRVLFIYSRSATNVFVSGVNTPADAMIRLSGAENAMSGFNEFKPLTAEAVVAANPDVILIPEKSLEGLGGEKGLWELPGLNLTRAGKQKNVAVMDDLLLLGFGPRLANALGELSLKWKSLK
ncbi:heme/hemin ABC transporter substrate-binding protein [Leptospira idonii]|uniref:Hemin ABC transporter substrate-binding protein n=1 Tax=Leptospira idonii TaxID=1193500 RepID=A0A4R9M2A8_9LEPT|nr:hemin ABC transporter substrate-binding protein [Leptospira idonii]TGN20242.1 hemin ABC transporter substrate-binding protein [Leptospira idonii]